MLNANQDQFPMQNNKQHVLHCLYSPLHYTVVFTQLNLQIVNSLRYNVYVDNACHCTANQTTEYTLDLTKVSLLNLYIFEYIHMYIYIYTTSGKSNWNLTANNFSYLQRSPPFFFSLLYLYLLASLLIKHWIQLSLRWYSFEQKTAMCIAWKLLRREDDITYKQHTYKVINCHQVYTYIFFSYTSVVTLLECLTQKYHPLHTSSFFLKNAALSIMRAAGMSGV
jgi:hypothetical protein